MSLAQNLIPVIAGIINDFGSDIVLKKIGSSRYDVALGKTVTTPGTETSLKATYETYSSNEIMGLIQAGDIKVLVAFNENIYFDIATDKLVIGSIEYSIISIQPQVLQNKTLFWEVQVRK